MHDSVVIRQAEATDIHSIVRMHGRAFPGFFMTALGPSWLRAYYMMVREYPKGVLLVGESAGQEVGFVAGFIDPSDFYSRLRARRLRLAFACAVGVLRSPYLVLRLLRTAGQLEGRSDTSTMRSAGVAELSSVAIDPRWRGRGYGRELIGAFVQTARVRGALEVRLTTDARDNDQVNGIYSSAGFRLTRCFEKTKGRLVNEYVYDLE